MPNDHLIGPLILLKHKVSKLTFEKETLNIPHWNSYFEALCRWTKSFQRNKEVCEHYPWEDSWLIKNFKLYNLKIRVCSKISHSALNVTFFVFSYNELLSRTIRFLTFVIILRPPKYSNLLFGKDLTSLLLPVIKTIILKSHWFSVEFLHYADGIHECPDKSPVFEMSSKERIRHLSSGVVTRATGLLSASGVHLEQAIEAST